MYGVHVINDHRGSVRNIFPGRMIPCMQLPTQYISVFYACQVSQYVGELLQEGATKVNCQVIEVTRGLIQIYLV